MRFEHTLDSALAKPDCLRRRRRLAPQLEKPAVGKVVAELKHLRVVTPELLAHAVREPIAFLLKVFRHA
jgi:hypothetical protein